MPEEVTGILAATLALALTAVSGFEALPTVLPTDVFTIGLATLILAEALILFATVAVAASTVGAMVPADEVEDKTGVAELLAIASDAETVLIGLEVNAKLTALGVKRMGETCAAKVPTAEASNGMPGTLDKAGETGSIAINEPSAPVTSDNRRLPVAALVFSIVVGSVIC